MTMRSYRRSDWDGERFRYDVGPAHILVHFEDGVVSDLFIGLDEG